jgi:uncharacterized membrane protein YheB (UPF0754 family)
MTSPWLFTFPLLGALAGWGANHLAFVLLFRPRRPVRIPGLTLHGLIPRSRRAILEGAAGTAARLLADPRTAALLLERVNPEDVSREILDRSFDEHWESLPLVSSPLVGALAGDLKGRIKARLARGIGELLASRGEEIARGMLGRIDIRRLILDRTPPEELDRLEAALETAARRELLPIKLAGGLFGLLVGSLPLILESLA